MLHEVKICLHGINCLGNRHFSFKHFRNSKIQLANFHLLKKYGRLKKTNMKNGFFFLTKDAILVLGCGQLNCCHLSILFIMQIRLFTSSLHILNMHWRKIKKTRTGGDDFSDISALSIEKRSLVYYYLKL